MKNEVIRKLREIGLQKNQLKKTGDYKLLVRAKRAIINEPFDCNYSEKYFYIREYLGA